MDTITIVVVDDHPHVAIAVGALLESIPHMKLVAQARSGKELIPLLEKTRPHVLFLDLMLEATFDPLVAVSQIRSLFPELKICLLSAHIEPSYVRDLLKAGVSGYILKDDDYVSRIEVIIQKLAAGDLYLSQQAYEALAYATRQEAEIQLLSERETEILRLASQNMRNPQIAQRLCLSSGTVRNHLSTVYRKLGVRSRHEALEKAKEQNLI